MKNPELEFWADDRSRGKCQGNSFHIFKILVKPSEQSGLFVLLEGGSFSKGKTDERECQSHQGRSTGFNVVTVILETGLGEEA